MAEGGWEQERLDLEQWQQTSMAILLALGCSGEGAKVWLNEASVLARSGCPGQGFSWEMPSTPTSAQTLPFGFLSIPCIDPSGTTDITGWLTVPWAVGWWPFLLDCKLSEKATKSQHPAQGLDQRSCSINVCNEWMDE